MSGTSHETLHSKIWYHLGLARYLRGTLPARSKRSARDPVQSTDNLGA